MSSFEDKAIALGWEPLHNDACNRQQDTIVVFEAYVGLNIHTVVIGTCMCCGRVGVALQPDNDNEELVKISNDLADDVRDHLAETPTDWWQPGDMYAALKVPLVLPQQLLLRLRIASM